MLFMFNTCVKRSIIVATMLHVLLGWCGLADADECTESAISTKSDAVQRARSSLLALPIGDGYQTDVSAAGRRAIAGMKATLVDLIGTYMSCAPDGRTPEVIQAELGRLGHAVQCLTQRKSAQMTRIATR
jgi:hypothetical protein